MRFGLCSEVHRVWLVRAKRNQTARGKMPDDVFSVRKTLLMIRRVGISQGVCMDGFAQVNNLV